MSKGYTTDMGKDGVTYYSCNNCNFPYKDESEAKKCCHKMGGIDNE